MCLVFDSRALIGAVLWHKWLFCNIAMLIAYKAVATARQPNSTGVWTATCLYAASCGFANALSAAVAGSHSWGGSGIKSSPADGLGLTAWGKVQGVPAALDGVPAPVRVHVGVHVGVLATVKGQGSGVHASHNWCCGHESWLLSAELSLDIALAWPAGTISPLHRLQVLICGPCAKLVCAKWVLGLLWQHLKTEILCASVLQEDFFPAAGPHCCSISGPKQVSVVLSGWLGASMMCSSGGQPMQR